MAKETTEKKEKMAKKMKKNKSIPNPFDSFSGFAKGIHDRVRSRKGKIKSEDIPF